MRALWAPSNAARWPNHISDGPYKESAEEGSSDQLLANRMETITDVEAVVPAGVKGLSAPASSSSGG